MLRIIAASRIFPALILCWLIPALPNADTMIAAARSCLGTRFRHQGRTPGRGLDCLGLIVVAAQAAGITMADQRAYSRQPNQADFQQYVAANAMALRTQVAPGRIGVFDFGAGPQHVGLFTGAGLIHAYAPARKVIEHGWRAPWPGHLSHIYAFPQHLG
ncbi:MAG: NlpC/P60 family protein [Pseudomonadota bacterium]